jgi:hypothetical protein
MSSRLTKLVCSIAVMSVFGASQAFAAGDADLHESMVKMAERQAKDVSAHAPDCDKIADALLKSVDDDAALMKKVMAAEKTKTKEQKTLEKNEFMKKYAPRMKAAQEKMAPAKKCRDNAKMKEWKKKLDAATDPRQ